MTNNNKTNKNEEFFKKICKIDFLIGSQNYWNEGLDVPSAVIKFHTYFMNFVTCTSTLLILLQWGVLFTEQNLTEKQTFDSKLFALAHPLSLATVLTTERNRKKVGDLLKHLVVTLKEIYNDEEVEMKMIKTSKFVLKAYSIIMFMTALLYGVDGYIQVLRGQSFVTIVTAWPDVEDSSRLASIARVCIFLIWSLLLLRLTSIFIIVIPLSICLGHQYMNLRSYFEKLNEIFLEECSQHEKEKKYEKAFKDGLKLHAETLVCVKNLQTLFNSIYGGQIIIKSTGLMVLMSSMANAERSLSHVATTIVTASYTLISLGCLMWNAGNTTVEAASLPSAIFGSGWHNCTKKSSVRIRPLVVLALQMSQKPVILQCLGSVKLSYQSYVSIVKSCYSGFSVIY